MGCCCDGGTTYPPDEPPVPPPLCSLQYLLRIIDRDAIAGIGSTANDDAWASLNAMSFDHSPPYGFRFGAYLSNRGIYEAYYDESRLYVLLSLRRPIVFPSTFESGNYSISDLYGVDELTLRVAMTMEGRFDHGVARQPASQITSYTQTWSTVDLFWGLVDDSDLNALKAFPAASLGSGLLDFATNSLADSVTVDGASVAFDSRQNGGFDIDLTPILSEIGSHWLLILAKVHDDDIAQESTPGAGGIEEYGPQGQNVSVIVLSAVHRLTLKWACIKTITVRTVIEQATSSIIEEDRTKTCTYVSGQNLTKRFRSIDNTPGGGMSLEEFLYLTVPSGGDNWLQPDPSGLDKTNRFSATPTAAAQLGFEEADEDTAQTWDLEVATLAHEAGSITVIAYAYVADPTATFKMDFEFKPAGGSFGSAVQVQWDDATAAWKSAVLATGLSVGDLASGAQLRMTPREHGGGDEDYFETIYLKVESTGSADVERTLDVYLTESGGDYFITFGYLRETDPNDSDWYVGRQTTPFVDTVALGDVSRETIGDLIGLSIPFSHNGADNDNTGNGTEDATITFTITDIAI